MVGQAALEKRRILLTDVPENYAKITSGLGENKAANIVVPADLFEESQSGDWNFQSLIASIPPTRRSSTTDREYRDRV